MISVACDPIHFWHDQIHQDDVWFKVTLTQ